MQTYTYLSKGQFAFVEKPKPVILHERCHREGYALFESKQDGEIKITIEC